MENKKEVVDNGIPSEETEAEGTETSAETNGTETATKTEAK